MPPEDGGVVQQVFVGTSQTSSLQPLVTWQDVCLPHLDHQTAVPFEAALADMAERSERSDAQWEASRRSLRFSVLLQRGSPQDKYGIAYQGMASFPDDVKPPGQKVLRVTQVKEGLCDGYNKQMRLFPEESSLRDREVRPGDYIIAVNGCINAEEMKEALKDPNASSVRLILVRSGRSRAAVAFAPLNA
eukprot:TRINITY_DN34925_c0_g1_i1.p1 TRINITY_DN34925_c0_g1~~TRINITY_DN34925_c0_g1_i1.p1  ORF type:complete len:189 (-),score=55.59 TRINITY_DN34925_c0_g1_i1:123-689(-)